MTNKIRTLTIGILLATATAGAVAAQDDAIGTQEGVFGEEGIFGDELFEDPAPETIDAPEIDPLTVQCNGDDALNAITDVDAHRELAESRTQDVDADTEDILLGIALANNGVTGITFENLRDFTFLETSTASLSHQADLDRDDVFSALALGLTSGADSLSALECVADVQSQVTQTTEATQTVELDEQTVLLAIALKNSVGGELDLSDVASISTDARTTLDKTQTVDVDRDDVFLALALGAGGDADAPVGENGSDANGDALEDPTDANGDDAGAPVGENGSDANGLDEASANGADANGDDGAAAAGDGENGGDVIGEAS